MAEGVVDELGELQHVCACDVAGVFVGELYAVDVGDVEEVGHSLTGICQHTQVYSTLMLGRSRIPCTSAATPMTPA